MILTLYIIIRNDKKKHISIMIWILKTAALFIFTEVEVTFEN